MKPHRAAGFTLIEILAVISICAVLAALIFPELESAQRSAASVACQQNLKNIGTGIQEYATDNNGWFPPHFMTDGNGHTITWYGFVAPYITGWNGDVTKPMAKVFFCPDRSNTPPAGQTYLSTAQNVVGQTYGYNYFNITRNYAFQQIARRQSVGHLAKLVLAGDIPQMGSQQASQPLPGTMSKYLMYPAAAVLAKRHSNGTCNIVFADGHVASVSAVAFTTAGMLFDMQNWNPFAITNQ